ncbi:MAG: Do family serine endopeptidase [Hyphomonadaceae bacterium]|nr:Do family serine endopeptidase [Hyphomonadaceae bacterium]
MNRQNILLVVSASLVTALVMLGVPALGQLVQNEKPVVTSAQPEPSPQVERYAPTSQVSMQESFAPIVQRTAPAVVNVYSSVTVTRSNCPYANDPVFSRLCGGAQTRNEKVDNSLGSGVIVGADGVIVTNNHVVEAGEQFRVVLNDRREFPAVLVMKDDRTDLAVLKIDTKGQALPTLDYADTRGVQVGDLVIAIGNPFGVGQTVTSGIVSALARTDVGVSDYSSFIQTDASINPGNSGGALVDMRGRLVGVNSMIFSRGGGSNGIGFAIPSEMVKRVVDAAVHGGTLVRPWLGAKGDVVTNAIAQSLNLDRPKGVLISDVYPGSPAEKAGLKKGDLVLSIDGREVFDDKGMKFIAATKAEGETVDLSIITKGQPKLLRAKLAAPPGSAKEEQLQVKGRNPFTGAVVVQTSPALAENIGLDPFKFQSGVMIFSVPARTIAASLRFQPGDIIREVNGSVIRTPQDLEAAIKRSESSPDRVWRLAIDRNGERKEITLQG